MRHPKHFPPWRPRAASPKLADIVPLLFASRHAIAASPPDYSAPQNRRDYFRYDDAPGLPAAPFADRASPRLTLREELAATGAPSRPRRDSRRELAVADCLDWKYCRWNCRSDSASQWLCCEAAVQAARDGIPPASSSP